MLIHVCIICVPMLIHVCVICVPMLMHVCVICAPIQLELQLGDIGITTVQAVERLGSRARVRV